MIEQIKKLVLSQPDYLILRHEIEPKENLRLAYNTALGLAGLPIGHKEPTFEMFLRVGDFIFSLERALGEVGANICESIGYEPDVVGNLDMQGLPKEYAADLFNIHHALHHAEKIKRDVVESLLAYNAKISKDKIFGICNCPECAKEAEHENHKD